jgi:hypothetical protein
MEYRPSATIMSFVVARDIPGAELFSGDRVAPIGKT